MRNLDPALYIDNGVFARERSDIFAKSWQLLGPVSKLDEPGSYISTEVAGLGLFAIRARDGNLRGFRNVCRHRGARLLPEGTGRCGPIRCPYHNWVYSDEGKLLNAPWFGEDPDFDKSDWPLEPVSLEIWRGLLFAAIHPRQPLVKQLGALVEELDEEPIETYAHYREERMVFGANWKTYTDNFVEGYHIPGIHPAFFSAIDFEKFSTVALEGFVRMTAPPRDGLFYRGKWLWMWPNWTLSLFDGGMNTSRINPLDENRTELIYNFYFADSSEQARPAQDDTIRRNLAVVTEDFEVCVDTQKNYATGSYSPGPLSPRHEQGVAYFQNQVRDWLGLQS
ncbi:MAG: aromatic ring-hydroxylating dioxygenase subunit alpha [Parvibaculaceae bacterium]